MALLSKQNLQSRFDAWKAGAAGSWRMKLFQNNLTPDPTNVVGDFTESTFTGYASVLFGVLGADTWDGVNFKWTCTVPSFNYTGTGVSNQNVYGYYIIDGGGVLVASKRFAGAPFLCGVSGTSIGVTISMEDLSEFLS